MQCCGAVEKAKSNEGQDREAYDLMNCVQVDFWDRGTACV
jgi:hypothetical protein